MINNPFKINNSKEGTSINKYWWEMDAKETCLFLETDLHQGLGYTTAIKRLKEEGLNKIPAASGISILNLLLNQFSNFIIWVLIGATLIAGMLQEWIDALVICVILIFNALLGFIQEYRAAKSLEALKRLSNPTSKIIREGKLKTLPVEEIVPGDLILLETGDQIPADGRIVESIQLATQEAALTGESIAIQKTADKLTGNQLPIGDRINKAFKGTIVASGKGRMIATETGINTEIGKISSLLQQTMDERTPLQIRLNRFGKHLLWGCLAIILIIFGLGISRGYPYLELILTSLSLAVAIIPEGLPAIVTIVLAIGVRRMSKRNALIRRLASVETLGCTTVICADKTGTLTQNEMVVRSIWVDQTFIQVSGLGYVPEGSFEKVNGEIINPAQIGDLELLLRAVSLCNNANLYQENNVWKITGDPTEASLLVAAHKFGMAKEQLEQHYLLKNELPFDSERKYMSVVRHDVDQHKYLVFTKGAVDVILKLSNHLLLNGKLSSLTEDLRISILQANHQLASQGLRVLAVAYKEVQENLVSKLESDLTLIGLIAMMDPPRPEVKPAILACKEAGIRTIMITGDHKDTAVAIAKDLDLMSTDSIVLDGHEIENIDENTLRNQIERVAVYARVSSSHKLKIVKCWKQRGEIVAMTGDGINDAPAIKEADIGIAMGLTGTDVTKEASDMVITDDNFASIVKAVEEGRGLYNNIVRFISYLFSTNLAEVLIIFFALLLNIKDNQGNPFFPLLPAQILLINLLSDGFPAIALGLDPIDRNVMKQPPRNPNSSLIPFGIATQLVIISFIITIATLSVSYLGLKEGKDMAQTMAFTTLVVLELVKVPIIRSMYNLSFFSNPWIFIAVASSFTVQLLVIYNSWLQKIFNTIALGYYEWTIIGLTAAIVWFLSYLVSKNISVKEP